VIFAFFAVDLSGSRFEFLPHDPCHGSPLQMRYNVLGQRGSPIISWRSQC
jgi:hypothetical protein